MAALLLRCFGKHGVPPGREASLRPGKCDIDAEAVLSCKPDAEASAPAADPYMCMFSTVSTYSIEANAGSTETNVIDEFYLQQSSIHRGARGGGAPLPPPSLRDAHSMDEQLEEVSWTAEDSIWEIQTNNLMILTAR
jgi:hypothetical protein